jgi:tetrahydromethanopterin S-methyltransferase subunit G
MIIVNEKIKAYYVADDIDEVLNYIDNLEKENARLKEIENKLNFIKNRVKQGMSQENINKCAIELVNSYLKEN